MTAPAPPAVALSLASVESYLRARGLAATYPDALVIRGVGDAVDLATAKANRAVMLTRGAGPGLAWEQTFDRPIVTVRCIGRQRDYDDAERFAFAVDRWLQAPSPVDVGGTRACTWCGPVARRRISSPTGRAARISRVPTSSR
jgi:hypothetical protein